MRNKWRTHSQIHNQLLHESYILVAIAKTEIESCCTDV